jgi:hypothetical protein
MLSENDKQQIRELLEITHEDIQVFNLEYIYQKVENLFNKEIFTDYVEYLKHNPEVDGLDDEILIQFEHNICFILVGTMDIDAEYEEITEVIDSFRYWMRYRDENQGEMS